VRTLEEQIKRAHAVRQLEAEGLDLLRAWWEEATGCPTVFQSRSARHFMGLLSLEHIREAMDAAGALIDRHPEVSENPLQAWKYFCGACWTMIRRERDARSLDPGQR
jgi:hypothetical protein